MGAAPPSPESIIVTGDNTLGDIVGTYTRFAWQGTPLAPFGEKYSKNMYLKANTNFMIMQWDKIGG